MARAKWVLVSKPSILNKKQWENYIQKSYELIKARLTRKTRKDLGIE
jgi:predicted DNA-binding protein (MmcQ/YjbR family)